MLMSRAVSIISIIFFYKIRLTIMSEGNSIVYIFTIFGEGLVTISTLSEALFFGLK